MVSLVLANVTQENLQRKDGSAIVTTRTVSSKIRWFPDSPRSEELPYDAQRLSDHGRVEGDYSLVSYMCVVLYELGESTSRSPSILDIGTTMLGPTCINGD